MELCFNVRTFFSTVYPFRSFLNRLIAANFLIRSIIRITANTILVFPIRWGSNPGSLSLIARRQEFYTPSGMEKKRDPAAKGTDLETPGIRCQLRQDCIGARCVH